MVAYLKKSNKKSRSIKTHVVIGIIKNSTQDTMVITSSQAYLDINNNFTMLSLDCIKLKFVFLKIPTIDGEPTLTIKIIWHILNFRLLSSYVVKINLI